MLDNGMKHRASLAIGPSVQHTAETADENPPVGLQAHVALIIKVPGVDSRVGCHGSFSINFPLVLLRDFGRHLVNGGDHRIQVKFFCRCDAYTMI